MMEELVGITTCVLGDMASHPNFGLNKEDFFFSTLVVGSSSKLPATFANCPKSHKFEPGSFTFAHRLGTFIYEGTIFAIVGFVAELVGTALSNGLIKLRMKMDPNFEMPRKAPPTLLNAFTWLRDHCQGQLSILNRL
ncbi:hypothetical protein UlMin_004113 [Ulmus minor]